MNRSLALFLLLTTPLMAAEEPPLPPVPAWSGASRKLIRPAGDPWITPAEASGFRRTPSYDETAAWLRRLEAATRQVRLVSIGRSGEGRDMWMAVVSQEGARTPQELRAAGRPVVMAQAGIHAGEIDGKDAGLMLLRDLALGDRKDLLSRASLLFIPMLNPDGHERIEPFGRINQRGPENAGWRTTSTNLNINRDYMKLDAPETRAVVAAIEAWSPDLYIDLHVTDGGDYQADVMYGGTGRHGRSPAGAAWLIDALTPAVDADLRAGGHVPGPLWLGNLVDSADPSKGYEEWPQDARLSHTYGDARALPTILVENHSLKPYERRVLSNRVLLESVLRFAGAQAGPLRAAIAADRARRDAVVTLAWQRRKEAGTAEIEGVAWEMVPSSVTGAPRVSWTGQPRTERVPFRKADEVLRTATRPRAYWIPPAWTEVIERLQAHGIVIERQSSPRELDVEACRLTEWKLGAEPFEGRIPLTNGCAMERRRERLPVGSVRVPTDQPLGTLAMLLLEGTSQDSFLQWGFFHPILQRTEYVEAYVMEPLAERMLASDPALKADFERALAEDEALAAPAERLAWLYRRTPYADARYLLYPVFREP